MTISEAIFIAFVMYPHAAPDGTGIDYNPPVMADIAAAIEAAHGDHDPWTLAALVIRESRGRVNAVGKLGECGITQVMGWYTSPVTECADLRSPLVAIQATVGMLDDWARRRPKEDPWQCYASGNKCKAPRSTRKLDRIRARLLFGFVAGVLDL